MSRVKLGAALSIALCASFVSYAAEQPQLALQTGHASAVMALRFSDDGQFLLSSDRNGGAAIWSLSSYSEVRNVRLPQSKPNAVQLDPGFQLQIPDFVSDFAIDVSRDFLATSSLQGPVLIWRLSTGKVASILPDSTGVNSLSLNSDHSVLATKQVTGAVSLWDTMSWANTQKLTGGAPEPDVLTALGMPLAMNTERESMRLSTEPHAVRSINRNLQIDLWDLNTHTLQKDYPSGPSRLYTIVALSARSSRIAIGDVQQSKVIVKDVNGSEPDINFDTGARLTNLAINSDGTVIAIAVEGGGVDTWQTLPSGVRKLQHYDCGTSATTSVEFGAGATGERLAAGTGTGDICLWTLPSTSPEATLSGAIANPLFIQFVDNAHLRIIDRGLVDDSHIGTRDWTFSFKDDSRELAFFDLPPRVPPRLTNYVGAPTLKLRDGEKFSPVVGHPFRHEVNVPLGGRTTMYLASNGGKLALLGDDQGTVTLYDNPAVWPPGRDIYIAPKAQLRSTGSRIVVAEFSDQDEYAFVGSENGTANLYRLVDSQAFQINSATNRAIRKAVFDPTGHSVAFSDNLGGVYFYNIQTQTLMQLFAPKDVEITGLSFDSTGSHLAIADANDVIELWDTTAHNIVSTISNVGPVHQLALSPDGTLIAALNSDGSVYLYRLADDSQIFSIANMISSRDYLVASPVGWFDGTADGISKAGWKVGSSLDIAPLDSFYNEFFLPNLMSDALNGTVPVPPHGSIADLLSLPGTASMLIGGKARIQSTSGKLILCLAAGASIEEQATAVGLYYKGRRQDLISLGFVEDASQPSCRYRKEVSDDGQPWQFLTTMPAPRKNSQNVQPSPAVDSGTVVVLSIGIHDYPGKPYPPLPNPAKDARAVATAISSATSPHIGNVQTIGPLVDGDATRQGIRTALDQAATSAKEGDVLVIFLSGHGTVPVGQEMFYFIPYYTQSSQFDTSFDERESGINIAMLVDAIRKTSAKRVILIVDACESGGLIDSITKVAEVKEALNQSPISGDASSNGGILILAAASPVEEAADPNNLGHGLLASTILTFLQSNEPKTADGLRRYVETALPNLAAKYHQSQTPMTYILGHDFYF